METTYRNLKKIKGSGSSIAKDRLKKEGFLSNLKIDFMSKSQAGRLHSRCRKKGKAKDFRLTYREGLRQAFFESLNNYKYHRKQAGLPCRGQRSHTNGNTAHRLKKILS